MIDLDKDINIHLEDRKVSSNFFWFIWILYSIVCMTKNCYNGSLASIVSEGVLTKSQTGAITAMFYLVYTPFQIVGGILADKYSPERMIKIGLVGAAISNMVIFLNQNYYVMLASWIFNGIIQFGIYPSVFKIISSQLVRSERKKMSFYISFSATSGVLLSYLLAAFVSDWKYNFAVSAISLILLAVVLHIYEKYLNPFMRRDAKPDNCETNEPSFADSKKLSSIRLFAAGGFFFILISTILSITVSQTRSTLTSVMLVENYDTIAPSLGNMLTAIMITAGMGGTILAGKFLKKVKNEVSFIVVISVLSLPFLIACSFIGTIPSWCIIAMFSVIACFDSARGLAQTNYTMYFSKYGLSGSAAGILNSGMAFSYMVAAYVMPRIVELFGWRTLLVLFPVLIVIAIFGYCLALRSFGVFKKQI